MAQLVLMLKYLGMIVLGNLTNLKERYQLHNGHNPVAEPLASLLRHVLRMLHLLVHMLIRLTEIGKMIKVSPIPDVMILVQRTLHYSC